MSIRTRPAVIGSFGHLTEAQVRLEHIPSDDEDERLVHEYISSVEQAEAALEFYLPQLRGLPHGPDDLESARERNLEKYEEGYHPKLEVQRLKVMSAVFVRVRGQESADAELQPPSHRL
ncbi:hypothetical protein HDU88_003587 [Geranomyces variabilis]|nr:hypothetical protein HDU88_003587 [Geranomyces variabilis]